MNYKTITQTAEILGCTKQYIWNLIAMRQLKAERVGSIWLIPDKEVQRIKDKKEGR